MSLSLFSGNHNYRHRQLSPNRLIVVALRQIPTISILVLGMGLTANPRAVTIQAAEIAQVNRLGAETPALPPPLMTDEETEARNYDQEMQAGYAAEAVGNLPKALQHFQAALLIRPQDIYAQQAIMNVKTFQLQQQQLEPPNRFAGIWRWWWIPLLGGALLAGGVWFRWSQLKQQQTFLRSINQRQQELEAKQQRLQQELFQTPTTNPAAVHSSRRRRSIPPRPPFPRLRSTANPPLQTQAYLESAPISTPLPQSSQRALPPPALPPHPSPKISLVDSDWQASLLKDLQSHDERLRHKTIWELARRGDSRAMPELTQLMMKSGTEERALILEALSQISGRTLRPMHQALSLSLNDPKAQVSASYRSMVNNLNYLHNLVGRMNQMLQAAQPQESPPTASKSDLPQ